VKKKLTAELDVESYFASAFIAPEQDFVEACAAIVANFLRKEQSVAPTRP